MLDTDRFNVYYGWSCDIIVAALFPSGKAESVIFKLGCSTGFAGKGVGSSVADNSGLDMGIGVWGLVAGFLPPLLFALGSFVQSEKREKGREWLENG